MKKVKFLRVTILLVIIICIFLGLFTTVKGYKMYQKALSEKSLSHKIESIRSKNNYTSIEDIPEIYLKAVISVEDHRFYRHHGIDAIAIMRAAFNDIRAMKLIEGGSTITQQLAKNLYFTQDKIFVRKIAEVFMAIKIENNYSKKEILELYLNSIYYGDGYYCIKDAAIGYFNKEPKEMTDYESTLLAGIPNAPSAYALTENAELANERQKRVLEKMIKHKHLSEEEAMNILLNKRDF